MSGSRALSDARLTVRRRTASPPCCAARTTSVAWSKSPSRSIGASATASSPAEAHSRASSASPRWSWPARSSRSASENPVRTALPVRPAAPRTRAIAISTVAGVPTSRTSDASPTCAGSKSAVTTATRPYVTWRPVMATRACSPSVPVSSRSGFESNASASRRESARPSATAAAKSLPLDVTIPDLLPERVGLLRGRLGRHEAFRPLLRHSLRRPLAGGIDSHLAAERRRDRRVVEIVDRAGDNLDVPRRIHVGAGNPRDLGLVLYVHVLVDDDDALGEHELAETPDRAHDLAGVAGIAFVDRDEHEVVENPGGREVHVDDLRQRLADQRQEDPLAGHADVVVLHRRDAHHGRHIHRIPAHRQARHVKDRKVVGERIEPRVIAEGSFAAALAGLDVSLEDYLRLRGHLEIDGPAL